MKELCLILSGVVIGIGTICWLLVASHRNFAAMFYTNPKDK